MGQGSREVFLQLELGVWVECGLSQLQWKRDAHGRLPLSEKMLHQLLPIAALLFKVTVTRCQDS